jgi:hypothetical protein
VLRARLCARVFARARGGCVDARKHLSSRALSSDPHGGLRVKRALRAFWFARGLTQQLSSGRDSGQQSVESPEIQRGQLPTKKGRSSGCAAGVRVCLRLWADAEHREGEWAWRDAGHGWVRDLLHGTNVLSWASTLWDRGRCLRPGALSVCLRVCVCVFSTRLGQVLGGN